MSEPLTMTEEELQQKIAEAVKKATEEATEAVEETVAKEEEEGEAEDADPNADYSLEEIYQFIKKRMAEDACAEDSAEEVEEEKKEDEEVSVKDARANSHAIFAITFRIAYARNTAEEAAIVGLNRAQAHHRLTDRHTRQRGCGIELGGEIPRGAPLKQARTHRSVQVGNRGELQYVGAAGNLNIVAVTLDNAAHKINNMGVLAQVLFAGHRAISEGRRACQTH